MRSIRRSLLGYLLVLLALGLGAVGLLVDRFAQAAITAREEAETKRIEQTFATRRQEVKAQLDAELVAEAKSLSPKRDEGVASPKNNTRGLSQPCSLSRSCGFALYCEW